MSWRRHLLIILVLTLAGAAINLPIAAQFVSSGRFPLRSVPKLNVIGASAAQYPWPQPPAEGQPSWPPPTQYQVQSEFAHTRIDAWSSKNNQAGFQMQCDRYGWPLPSLEESNRWWPWDNVTWQTAERPERPMHLVWSGVLLNPLMFALGIWALFLGLPAAWLALRARLRKKRGLCAKCAYPLVPSGVCPECGASSPAAPAPA
jgi:hypothetical protein